tara:strand:+ start:1575 stop:3923 length:2349 start_codon:yes stop_codon:yes gene_type:complete
MPRPVVEVHQSILNPVVTVTDPQSQVCLVGLNTESFTSAASTLNYDLSEAWNPAQQPAIPASDVEFTISSNKGPVITSDLDLGNNHVISGDVSVDLYDVSVVVASTLPGVATASTDFTAIEAPNAISYVSSNSPDVTKLSIVASPQADYLTKLELVDHPTSLDLTTGELADGTQVFSEMFNSVTEYSLGTLGGALPDSTFRVRKGYSSSLFIEPDQPAKFISGGTLATTGNLYIYNGNSKVFGDENSNGLQLSHAGTHRIPLLRAVDNTTLLSNGIIDLSLPSTLSHTGFLELATGESVPVVLGNDSLSSDPQGDGSVDLKIDNSKFIDSSNRVITKASYGANYGVAVNTYADRVYQLTSSDDLGEAGVNNPLALAHRVARANSGTTPVGVLGLDLSPDPQTGELKSLAEAHSEAIRVLEASSELYAYVPLTDVLSQLVVYKNSAEAMSVPAKGKFRIVLGASEGAPDFDYLAGSPSSASPCKIVGGELRDAEGRFLTLGLRKGESVTLLNRGDGSVVAVGSLDDFTGSSLTVSWVGGNPADGEYDYYVARNIATPQGRGRQIELLTGRLAGIASPRLVMVYPGSVNVSVTGSTIQDLPGYYGSAALAGLVASLEPHRPKNQIGLAGINGLDNSNFRFSDDEIDQISDAGYFVLIQETRDGAPFCVHQVTTQYGVAQGTQELTELSVVSNFDFVSRYFKKILVPYVGTHNIVPSVLGSIRGSLESGIANLRSRNTDRIGSPILSGSIEVLRQASYDSGTVEASISVSLPKVLNRIIIEVVSA